MRIFSRNLTIYGCYQNKFIATVLCWKQNLLTFSHRYYIELKLTFQDFVNVLSSGTTLSHISIYHHVNLPL